MLPLVLSHELIHPFKFWHEQNLQEGMCFGKELYQLVGQFKTDERQKAFSVAVELAETGKQICVTCLRSRYCVWVSLRSQTTAAKSHTSAIAA